jgi:hypothetical protein
VLFVFTNLGLGPGLNLRFLKICNSGPWTKSTNPVIPMELLDRRLVVFRNRSGATHNRKCIDELCGLNLGTNYSDRATAACREISANFCVGSTTDSLTAAIFGFLDRRRYFIFQVAPQLYSRGWVDPVPDPLLLRIKSIKFGPLDL